jgi:hypothetical protein
MAGWIQPCPADLGWLRPSDILSLQAPPSEPYQTVRGNILNEWSTDLLLLSAYLVGAPAVLVSSWRRNQPWLLAAATGVILVAGFIFRNKMPLMSPIILAIGAVVAVIGIYRFIWLPRRRSQSG